MSPGCLCINFMYKFGPVQKKILIVLLGGVVLGTSNSPRQYFRAFRMIKRDWKKSDKNNLSRSLQRLSSQKLVEEEFCSNGSCRLVLTAEGKRQAKKLSLIGSSIKLKKPKKWDGKWRIVVFDIPEKDRMFRDILRLHLKNLRFLKLQQSVFVSPHPFEKTILELVRLYAAENHVRVITATRIDNQDKLKRHFFKINKKD